MLAAILISLVACESLSTNYSAEVLATPFPATLSGFHTARFHTCNADGCSYPPERHCDTNNGCEIAFTARVTNPTDRDANVAECRAVIVVAGSRRSAPFVLPNSGITGLWVPAGTTRRTEGASALPLSYREIRRLPETLDATCTGLDWHDHPPV
jgi:hypothetical protein